MRKLRPIPILLAAALGLALAAGCGDDDTRPDSGGITYPDFGNIPQPDYGGSFCSAANCSGCCGNNQCLPGNTISACGYGGNTCQTCTSTQQCQAGLCTDPKCDSTTCPTGCCDQNGQCKEGTKDTACGTKGASCTACKSNEACASYKCQPKTSALYKVLLGSAKIETGYSCDTFGKCDLYLEVEVGGMKATSTVKEGNDNPTWDEVLLTATGSQILQKFYAKVYDDDWPFDQFVGECKPTVTNKEIAAGSFSVECGTSSSMGFLRTVTVTFKFQAV